MILMYNYSLLQMSSGVYPKYIPVDGHKPSVGKMEIRGDNFLFSLVFPEDVDQLELFSAKMLCLIDMQHGIGEVY